MTSKLLQETGFLSSVLFLYKESFTFSKSISNALEDAFENICDEFERTGLTLADEDETHDLIQQFLFLKHFRSQSKEVQAAFIQYASEQQKKH